MICADPREKCQREGCEHRSVFCFLMGDVSHCEWDGEQYVNWRLDLCEMHAEQFRQTPSRQWEGIESKIQYEEIK